MNVTGNRAVDEKIEQVIKNYIENYKCDHSLFEDGGNFKVEAYPVGESWMLHMVSYIGEVIASVLYCGEEVIVTNYFREHEIEMFN